MTSPMRLLAGLAALQLIAIASAGARSLGWFAGASALLLLALLVAGRQLPAATKKPLDSPTTLSLVLYAVLASIALITVRAALGWLERPVQPFDQLSLPAYMQGSVLGYYDKSEMRLALYEMLFFTVVLSVTFVRSAGLFSSIARRPFSLRAETAAFAVVLYFVAVHTPPYPYFNLPHWFPFIAGATAIQNGVWPFFSGFDFNYGLLCLAFLAVWLSAFGLSSLSLSVLISVSDVVCGVGTFVLIRRLTGSRALSLLATSCLLIEATDMLAVTSTFRSPVQIVLGALLLHTSLRSRRAAVWSGFLFGLNVLWNPVFGAFAAAGFCFAHGCLAWYEKGAERAARIKAMGSMLGGILVPLALLWAYTGPAESRLSAFYTGSAGNLFLLGYANLAQHFDLNSLAASVLGVLYLALVLHRLSRGKRMTPRMLFVGASLIAAIPYVMYALGRSDWAHGFAAYWALMPSMALLFFGLLRLLSLRRGEFAVQRLSVRKHVGLTAAVIGALFVVLFPLSKLAESIARYTTGTEEAKQRWAMDCAAGKGCNLAAKPNLANYFRHASRPLVSISPGLAAACREGVDILSENDALVYYAGRCFPSTRLPTVNLLVTRSEMDWYVGIMETRQQILYDNGKSVYTKWKGDMLEELKNQLKHRGFTEWRACNDYSILSKGDPVPLARKVCG